MRQASIKDIQSVIKYEKLLKDLDAVVSTDHFYRDFYFKDYISFIGKDPEKSHYSDYSECPIFKMYALKTHIHNHIWESLRA